MNLVKHLYLGLASSSLAIARKLVFSKRTNGFGADLGDIEV